MNITNYKKPESAIPSTEKEIKTEQGNNNAMKASCNGCRCPSCSRPSMVVTSCPSTSTAITIQEVTASLSKITVQAPHSPSAQEHFVPVR